MYINPIGEYPRFIGDIQLENPEWDSSSSLPEGWIQVHPVDAPTPSATQKVEEDFPIEIDGVFYQSWKLVELSQEELDFKNAPTTVVQKFLDLGFTNGEIQYLLRTLR